MNSLLPPFKVVSVVFAIAAIFTGAQALVDPIGFSRSFGIPITPVKDTSTTTTVSHSNSKPNDNPTTSYVSLMGVRQLATGITLLAFAYQGKWTEMATILSILGILVAGTDGWYLARSGTRSQGLFHAIPGGFIAILAGAVVFADG